MLFLFFLSLLLLLCISVLFLIEDSIHFEYYIKEGLENINKCAFVIPLHPKHFDYGYYIIDELNNADADLYFVFTNNEEKLLFEKNLPNPTRLKFLLLSDFVDLSIPEKTNSFVSIKKFYAISMLYTKYDYISCIDSEIKFIKNTNFYEMMKKIADNKTICGGKTEFNDIVRDSLLKLTDKRDHEKLKQISQNFNIYTWWSNIPVCETSNIKHFLTWINFNNQSLERFSWNIFDDITYNYFCILFYNYQLKIVPDFNNSLEFADSHIIENVDKNICKLFWVSAKAYRQKPEYYNTSDFYIIYHLDRDRN